MKEKDFIYIEFTGKAKDTGEIFDTTDEETAKKADLYTDKVSYGAVPIIIGGNQVIPGLEEVLKEMQIGESRKVDIPPEKAFGERSSEMVHLMSMSLFKEKDMTPEIGKTVNMNGIPGKIVSIDGGRVKIDFNHPLAGKTIEYDVKITGEIADTLEKVQSVVRYFTGLKSEEFTTEMKENEVTVSIKKFDLPRNVKKNMADTILKWVDGIKKVVFADIFESS
mgnify:CR=1 FL=1